MGVRKYYFCNIGMRSVFIKTAVLTFVYQGVEPYINDFMNSLQKQTDTNFDLIIINDGFKQLEQFISRFNINSRILHFETSFVGRRKQGIRWLKGEGYDTVVFADSDDYFNWQRVELTKKQLINYDLVCNELILFGENISGIMPMASSRFYDGQVLTLKNIYHGNIMGMSNTGARLNCILSLIDSIPDDVVAFDWVLYSLALLNRCTCMFTNKTKTYYRQYANNIASPRDYTEEQIIRGVKVKNRHYQIMSGYAEDYHLYVEEFKRLLKRLDNNKFRDEYCKAVRANAPEHPLWWEAIKTDRELNL